MTMLKGGCLCGAVGYEVEDAFHAAFNCHCSRCRRATGSAFKAMAAIRADALRVMQGTDAVLIYGDPTGTHDLHCGTCGSFLFSVIDNGNVHVAMGTLIDAPTIRPMFHIFTGSKAPWFEITDDLPQFEGLPS